jgi:heme exporter protein A
VADSPDRQDGAPPLEIEIEVEGLRKTFGRREVLRGLSFSLRRGGFLSIFGPNGAGKTTTLRVLATLLAASAGKVRVAGHDVRDDPMPVRRTIGLISHTPMLYLDLTAEENLRFYADMYGIADREARIAELLERLELSHRRYDIVRTFSKGMRQRLAIARAILHRPRVLLLDEPHSGLDPRAVDILDGLLGEIRAEHTFVMVTHNLAKGLEWGSRLMIIEDGRIAYEHAAGVDPDAFGAVYREHVREGNVL